MEAAKVEAEEAAPNGSSSGAKQESSPLPAAPSSPSKASAQAAAEATAAATAVAESIWSRIQASGILIPPEVIDKLAELDLELSEGSCRFKYSRF